VSRDCREITDSGLFVDATADQKFQTQLIVTFEQSHIPTKIACSKNFFHHLLFVFFNEFFHFLPKFSLISLSCE
jgi:hypothetical protein